MGVDPGRRAANAIAVDFSADRPPPERPAESQGIFGKRIPERGYSDAPRDGPDEIGADHACTPRGGCYLSARRWTTTPKRDAARRLKTKLDRLARIARFAAPSKKGTTSEVTDESRHRAKKGG